MQADDDFVYWNIPTSLEMKAWILMPDGEGLMPDTKWAETYKERTRALSQFFYANRLLLDDRNPDEWESWVLRFSDFTEEGKKFIMANYPDKWRAAWDRNPTRDPSDVKYLEMRLKQLRKQALPPTPGLPSRRRGASDL